MNFLAQFYANKDRKSLRALAIILFIAIDLLVLGHLYFKFSDPELFSHSLKLSLELQGANDLAIDQEFVTNLHELFLVTLKIMLSLAALAHLMIYFFWTKEKRFAITYIKTLSSVGGPLLFVWGIALLFSKSLLGVCFILGGILAFLLLPGIRLHFK